jgi:hypothetical protein
MSCCAIAGTEHASAAAAAEIGIQPFARRRSMPRRS